MSEISVNKKDAPVRKCFLEDSDTEGDVIFSGIMGLIHHMTNFYLE